MAEPKITVKCPSCKHNLTLGPANTVLIWVKQHEYMSYLQIECPRPQCGHEWSTFLEAEDPMEAHRMLKVIQKEAWPMRVHTTTSQHVIDEYEEAAELTLIKPVELTPRLESYVKVLGWELQDATVQDILDTDIEARLPKGCL